MEPVFLSHARAFGDGTHPTTAGVLAALDAIDPSLFTPKRACDMGAGSGILTLTLVSKFPCHVVAVDCEAEAVATLRENLARSPVAADRVAVVWARGFDHPAIHAAAPFDLLVMNILAEPLLGLAAEAEAHLAADGVLIVSGLLVWQETQIQAAYTGLGLELASRLLVGDWVTLVFQKP